MRQQFFLIVRYAFIFSVILISPDVSAQDPDDPGTFDPAVPVDGGLSLLLAAGLARGLWKTGTLRSDRNGGHRR